MALADELGSFVELVGGPDYSYVCIPPLESLSTQEETVVRDKAVESLNNVFDEMGAPQVEQYAIPLLKRLTDGEWFTSRTSACGLYAKLYEKASPDTREELRWYL